MTVRPLLLLAALGLAACATEPAAPSPEGTANPDVQTPVETPPGRLTVPGALSAGEDPGVPGSDRPDAWWPLDGNGACYAYESYVVRATPRARTVGEDIAVFDRTGDGQSLCDAPASDAVFSIAGGDNASHFFGLVGAFLLLDDGAGPDNRTLRVVALPGGQQVHAEAYAEPIVVQEGALVYGVAPEVVESMEEMQDLGVACPEARQWFDDGLAVGLSPQVRFDLATRERTPTGEVLCVPIQ